MPSPATTPQPQRGRQKQQQPKQSPAPPAMNNPSPAPNRTGGKQRQKHMQQNAQQNQAFQAPAWQDMQIPAYSGGDFDERGRYIAGPPDSNAVNGDSVNGDATTNGSIQPAKTRKAKQRQPAKSTVSESTVRVNGQYQDTNRMYDNNASQGPMATPAKAAYAGPTFHASPAASKLPVPKIFSKSVPSLSTQPSLQSRLDEEPPSDKEPPSDQSGSPRLPELRPAVTEPTGQDKSPLDFFFNADRQEKEKRKSTGSLLTPNSAAKSPPYLPSGNNWHEIYGKDEKRHSRHASNGSGKEVFMMELDGGSNHTNAAGLRSPEQFRNSASPGDPHTSPYSHHSPFNTPGQSGQNHRQTSTQSLPQNGATTRSPSLPPGASQSSPFLPPTGPRSSSGPSTPIPNGQNASPSQRFHYGNRNLSPMFQAAKGDSIKRGSSGLRQEMTNSSPTTNTTVHELPQPGQGYRSGSETPTKRRAAKPDYDEFSRQYLNSHIQGQGGSQLPNIPLPTRTASDSHLPPSRAPATPKGPKAMAGGNMQSPFQTPPSSSPSSKPMAFVDTAPREASRSVSYGSTTRDVKTMEDDLRKMLNLTVLSSNATGVR